MGGELTVESRPGIGSTFRVKLFVPEVHAAAAAPATSARPRRGYEGPARRVLVVDNEEADRDLLVQVLEPLGFELRCAASGHDALDLLAAGLAPHAILMDLAMPGIDGWETIRRLRRLGNTRAHVAIVSANAFDKGLENDVGIRSEDFILKPVRHSELLDWLERKLGLRWTEGARQPAPAAAPVSVEVWPAAEPLKALRDLVQLGYYRGIMHQLDVIESLQPECAAFAGSMRDLARQFQFEAMSRRLAGELTK